ncbi:MAG: LytTR family transcriptional regulator [Erysipelothrix sp.]|nr:LytTR family transcriptional regulator [Erysipelothrix sp.]
MRIQISNDLDKEEVIKAIRSATIVEDGDYILIPKNNRINVYDHSGIVFINFNDIDYIESLDNTIYVHSGSNSYVSMIKLYQYLELSSILIRISKTMIVNIYKISNIRPSLNMKYKIQINDQWLDVNRTYYYEFKDAIGI